MSHRPQRRHNARQAILRALRTVPGAVRNSVHPLRGGHAAREYLDLDLILADPRDCKHLVQVYSETIVDLQSTDAAPIDYLGFIEKASGGSVGAIRLAGAISIETTIPNLIVRPGKDVHIERIKLAPGTGAAALEGTRFVLITDHCSTGEEMLTTADIIGQFGGTTVGVVAATVRTDLFQGAEFAARGIAFRSLISAWDCEDLIERYDRAAEVAVRVRRAGGLPQ